MFEYRLVIKYTIQLDISISTNLTGFQAFQSIPHMPVQNLLPLVTILLSVSIQIYQQWIKTFNSYKHIILFSVYKQSNNGDYIFYCKPLIVANLYCNVIRSVRV